MDFYGQTRSRPFPVDEMFYLADALIVPPDATGFKQGAVFFPDSLYRLSRGQKEIDGWLRSHEGGGGERPATIVATRERSLKLSRETLWVAEVYIDPTEPDADYEAASEG